MKRSTLDLRNRSERNRLKPRKAPWWVQISDYGAGLSLGYYKGAAGGKWQAKLKRGDNVRWQSLGPAADRDSASGGALTFDQAAEAARIWATGVQRQLAVGKVLTLSDALLEYMAITRANGGDARGDLARLRKHLPEGWAARTLLDITPAEWGEWKLGLLEHGLAPATVNRTLTPLKAALRAAAERHKGAVPDPADWRAVLRDLGGAYQARQIILSESEVQRLLAAAKQDQDFYMLCLVAAATGARYGQVVALTVGDLQHKSARLLVPCTAKGDRSKFGTRNPVPIQSELVELLLTLTQGREDHEPLLTRTAKKQVAGGGWVEWRQRWAKSDQIRPMKAASRDALDRLVPFYAFRHSYIAHSLQRGVPVRVIAAICDTSVAMIEKNYSRYIMDVVDDVARSGLMNLAPTAAAPGRTVK